MLSRLKAGIARTRAGLARGVARLLSTSGKPGPEVLEELETVLLQADVGVAATSRIVDRIRTARPGTSPYETLLAEMTAILAPCEQPAEYAPRDDGPYVLLVVGVNGVGKTTTIAKVARMLIDRGRSVMLAAGDTYRAAAVEQLQSWGTRLGAPVVAQSAGADPASVIFDACAAARGRGVDVLIADTAGRLHTQDNLMAELAKVRRVIARQQEGAPHETLLVLDATMGQNALSQAEQFCATVEVTALCLTKLDGTAKGGIIFALAERFGLPIRFVGVGEGAADLQPFDAGAFTRALLADMRTTAET